MSEEKTLGQRSQKKYFDSKANELYSLLSNVTQESISFQNSLTHWLVEMPKSCTKCGEAAAKHGVFDKTCVTGHWTNGYWATLCYECEKSANSKPLSYLGGSNL